MKIGLVDAEIYSVDFKKEEISEGENRPVGKFAERAKKVLEPPLHRTSCRSTSSSETC